MKTIKYVAILALAAVIAFGCSPTRKLPSGTTLLRKQEVVFIPKNKQAEKFKSTLNSNLRPKANSRFLGVRLKLFFYNLVKEPKGKGIRYFIRNKMGEPPVLANKVSIPNNISFINNDMENSGFFRIQTTPDTSTLKKQTTFKYLINAGKRYRIRNIIYSSDSLAATKLIIAAKGKSLLKKYSFYSLSTIKSERERLDQMLKQHGYFYFNPDYIVAQADSNHNGLVDIYIKIKPDTPPKALIPYFIDSIKVYPTYSIASDSFLHRQKGILSHGIDVIDPSKRYRPSIFARAIQFRTGERYSRTLHSNSLSRMVNLNAFQFVNLTFTDADTGSLNATFLLTPAKRNSISLGITASTKSNNYYNTDIKATIKNRNLFRGAEMFEFDISSGVNTQLGGGNSFGNLYNIASNLNIYAPRLITPFERINWMKAIATKTQLRLGYEMVILQPDFTGHSLTTDFSYIWKMHQRDEHNITVGSINFVKPTKISARFDSAMNANPSLSESLRPQLIVSSAYAFTYSNQYLSEKKHQYYLNTSIELAGNILNLIKSKPKTGQAQKEILGVPFAQYTKVTIDYRSYLNFKPTATWANRIFLGIGVPYGNSSALPYVKQFYSGGSNSLRGFRAYTVGPGSFSPPKGQAKINETGDTKIELSTELRFGIYKIIKGAIFVDAGNIWILGDTYGKTGAGFQFNSFYKELAVSTGVGVRFDLTFLIFRFDLGMPIRKPYLPEGSRWVFNKIDFGSSQWRKDNLILNVAIGYPF